MKQAGLWQLVQLPFPARVIHSKTTAYWLKTQGQTHRVLLLQRQSRITCWEHFSRSAKRCMYGAADGMTQQEKVSALNGRNGITARIAAIITGIIMI